MKKLKIAFIVPQFPVTSQTFIVNQITDLINRGHEVEIFSLSKGNNAIIHQKILNNNLFEKVVYRFEKKITSSPRVFIIKNLLQNFGYINWKRFCKKFKFFNYQTKTFDIKYYFQHWWILKKQNFDVVHAHFGHAGIFFAQLRKLGFFHQSKFIVTFHGYDLNPSILVQLKKDYKRLFLEVDLMSVNTPYAKSLLQEITDHKKIVILPVGLNVDEFSPKIQEPLDELNILFVGRLISLKGPDLCIEIFRLLVEKGYNNLRLIIIGEGELNNELNGLIQKYGLATKVILTGALTQEEIKSWMNKSALFLLPGIHDKTGRAETQGLVIQEAQAMELPVIISDVGGMKYGMLNEKTGFVVREADIEAFVEKIEILVLNPQLRREMGKRGRKYVEDNYDSQILGEKLEKFYLTQ
ncbi:glycosyltransferase [Gramella sp. KN1008]|uniref:glycosyltransferase n=1 Tax=Gramella sp. KN1008 TaxID=2529298 RepID=UPI0010392F77|nr:glycosyltransferase [Gramella sp. KN1008]TBW25568.1 colanic acid biosynthesis glycosyltransferase WcaL [Gramella sp. KN1008]